MSNSKFILLCVNSDIGRGNSIGFRFGKIARELQRRKINFQIIARANYSNFSAYCPFYKNHFARILNGFRIYLLPFLNYRPLDIFLFDKFSLKKVKKMEQKGEGFSLAYFGELAPRTMTYLKNKGAKIIYDMPIAHYSYAQFLKSSGFIWDDEIKNEKSIDQVLEIADLIVARSDFVKETINSQNKDLFNKKNIEIISFGADLPNNFNEKNIEKRIEEIKNDERKIRFLFVGAVNFRKGVNFLLEAWQKANLEKAELIFCGRVYKKMRQWCQKNNFHNVKFIGFVNPRKYLEQSDVFIFPSLLEGSAKSIFEAMAYGLPVITTFNSGSAIEDGRDGFIVPIGDSEMLAEKMKFFYDNPDQIVQMGKMAWQKAHNYTWDKYGQKVVDVLENF